MVVMPTPLLCKTNKKHVDDKDDDDDDEVLKVNIVQYVF